MVAIELIAFASLLVGLIVGEQDIRLEVADRVDHVRLVLDGKRIGTLDGPPWLLQYDFGAELQPHELVAVAFDSSGKELTRISQWINLPRALVEADLFLEGSLSTRQRTARLSWSNVYGTEPSEISVLFDGKRLQPDDLRRIRLPAHDPNQPHVLHAELDFGAYGSATTELAFGGGFGEQVWTQLTAVPVLLDEKRRSLEPHELAGWFLSDGDVVAVSKVANGAANVKIVIGIEARIQLHLMSQNSREMFNRIRGQPRNVEKLSGPKPLQRADEQISVFWPAPKHLQQDGLELEVFEGAGPYTTENPLFANDLAYVIPKQPAEGKQQLAETVATAGLAAAAGGHRRAVVLIIADNESDSSSISAAVAADFLQRLCVPLYVWTPSRKMPRQGPWGEVEYFSSLQSLSAEFKRLSKALSSQHVVWLEGAHLPQSITLSAKAQQIRIAR